MMSIFRRLWQYIAGEPEEQIIEIDLINENNKRCQTDNYSDADYSSCERKRFKISHEDADDVSDDSMYVNDSFQSTSSFSIKPNGIRSRMEKNNNSDRTKLQDNTLSSNFKHKNMNGQVQKIKENLPFSFSPSFLKYSNKCLLKNSSLQDLVTMREKLAYGTLIRSHASITTSIGANLQNLKKTKILEPSVIVDLTKDDKSQCNSSSVLRNHGNSKLSHDSSKNITSKSLQNITFRKKTTSPITKHTEWIHNLTKEYDQKGVQRKLKINDELLRADVYKNKNQIFHDVINERLLKQLQIKEVIELVEEKPVSTETVLPVFTPEQEEQISRAMRLPAQEKIIQKFGYAITGACIYSLSGLNWLNDNVINFYMKLLTQRGEEPGKLKVHAMDSFFCVNLRTRGYSSVRRWTRKVDIFSFDLMPIPVHVNGVHWCMLIINFKEKTLKYYDSMGGSSKGVLEMIETYLKEESLDKKKNELDFSEWTKETVKDIPQQMNGCDCGVFSCMFAEYICRGAKINFSQQDMKYFRRKMCLEIIQGKLLT